MITIIRMSSCLLLLGTAAWGSTSALPPYKNPDLPVEERVADLLGRMTIEDKMAQLMQGSWNDDDNELKQLNWSPIQGDITNWMNDTTGAFNASGLVANMAEKAGMFYGMHAWQTSADPVFYGWWLGVVKTVGYPISWEWLTTNIQIGQNYLQENTTLGIPALVQSEGIHGFLIGNATIFNSPIGYGSSWNRDVSNVLACLDMGFTKYPRLIVDSQNGRGYRHRGSCLGSYSAFRSSCRLGPWIALWSSTFTFSPSHPCSLKRVTIADYVLKRWKRQRPRIRFLQEKLRTTTSKGCRV